MNETKQKNESRASTGVRRRFAGASQVLVTGHLRRLAVLVALLTSALIPMAPLRAQSPGDQAAQSGLPMIAEFTLRPGDQAFNIVYTALADGSHRMITAWGSTIGLKIEVRGPGLEPVSGQGNPAQVVFAAKKATSYDIRVSPAGDLRVTSVGSLRGGAGQAQQIVVLPGTLIPAKPIPVPPDDPAVTPIPLPGPEIDGVTPIPLPGPVIDGATPGKIALECEEMKVLKQPPGDTLQKLPMNTFGPDWSKNAIIWLHPGRLGASFTLELPAAEAGTYAVSIHFTKAPDYGIVQVDIDGKPLGQPFDGYHPKVVRSDAVSLGAIELSQGSHSLSFKVVGKNEKASSFMVGPDKLLLTRVKSPTIDTP